MVSEELAIAVGVGDGDTAWETGRGVGSNTGELIFLRLFLGSPDSKGNDKPYPPKPTAIAIITSFFILVQNTQLWYYCQVDLWIFYLTKEKSS